MKSTRTVHIDNDFSSEGVYGCRSVRGGTSALKALLVSV